MFRNLENSEIAGRVQVSCEDDRFVLRPPFSQILQQRFGVRSLRSNEFLLECNAPGQTARTLACTFVAFDVTIKVSTELPEERSPMRDSADRYRKAVDRYAITRFDGAATQRKRASGDAILSCAGVPSRELRIISA